MPRESLHIGELHDKPFGETQNYLAVNSCGAQRIVKTSYRVIRENGRKDFHILYVESGSCCVFYEGECREIFKGQYVLYIPDQKQEYSFSAETSSVTYWVHFHGTHAQNILADCDLKGGINTAQNPHEAEKTFRGGCRCFSMGHRIPIFDEYSVHLVNLIFSRLRASTIR